MTNAAWASLAPLVPEPTRRGRPRRWALRRLGNALFSLLRPGCAWRYRPREYSPWPTVYATVRRWRLMGVWQRVHEAVRRAVRPQAARHPDASARRAKCS